MSNLPCPKGSQKGGSLLRFGVCRRLLLDDVLLELWRLRIEMTVWQSDSYPAKPLSFWGNSGALNRSPMSREMARSPQPLLSSPNITAFLTCAMTSYQPNAESKLFKVHGGVMMQYQHSLCSEGNKFIYIIYIYIMYIYIIYIYIFGQFCSLTSH